MAEKERIILEQIVENKQAIDKTRSFTKALDRMATKVQAGKISIEQAEKVIKRYGLMLDLTADEQRKLAATTATATKAMRKQGASARYLGIQFGYLISDLQFGVLGIANNVSQMAVSFIQVREEAKLTGVSVRKSLAGMFKGGNAYLILLQLIIAAWQFLSLRAQKANRQISKTAKDGMVTLEAYKRIATGVLSTEQQKIDALKNLEKQGVKVRDLNGDLIRDQRTINRLVKEHREKLIAKGKVEVIVGKISQIQAKINEKNVLTFTDYIRVTSNFFRVLGASIPNLLTPLKLLGDVIEGVFDSLVAAFKPLADLWDAVAAPVKDGRIKDLNKEIESLQKELDELLKTIGVDDGKGSGRDRNVFQRWFNRLTDDVIEAGSRFKSDVEILKEQMMVEFDQLNKDLADDLLTKDQYDLLYGLLNNKWIALIGNAEVDAFRKTRELRQQYGISAINDFSFQKQQELDILKDHLNKKLLSEEEYGAAVIAVKRKYAIQEIQAAGRKLQQLHQLTGKAGGLAIAGVIMDQGAALFDVVKGTQARIKAIKNLPDPTGISQGVLIAKAVAEGALESAVIVAQAKRSISQIKSAGGRGGSASSAGGDQSRAPNFNIIGAAGGNQLRETIDQRLREQGRNPIKAYVVEGEAQAARMARENAENQTTFG